MKEGPLPPHRRLTTRQFKLISGVMLVAVTLVMSAGEVIDDSRDLGPVLEPWAVLTILAITTAYSVLCWGRLDGAAREAHKWAWLWGANTGAVGALGLLLLGDRAINVVGKLGFDNTLADGMALVLAFEIVTYAVAWAFWWLRRR